MLYGIAGFAKEGSDKQVYQIFEEDGVKKMFFVSDCNGLLAGVAQFRRKLNHVALYKQHYEESISGSGCVTANVNIYTKDSVDQHYWSIYNVVRANCTDTNLKIWLLNDLKEELGEGGEVWIWREANGGQPRWFCYKVKTDFVVTS